MAYDWRESSLIRRVRVNILERTTKPKRRHEYHIFNRGRREGFAAAR
jgi:hypothetical protein